MNEFMAKLQEVQKAVEAVFEEAKNVDPIRDAVETQLKSEGWVKPGEAPTAEPTPEPDPATQEGVN